MQQVLEGIEQDEGGAGGQAQGQQPARTRPQPQEQDEEYRHRDMEAEQDNSQDEGKEISPGDRFPIRPTSVVSPSCDRGPRHLASV